MRFQQFIDFNLEDELKKMVKPPGSYKLVWVNTRKFDKAWKKDVGFYIGKGGLGHSIGNRYVKFQDLLYTEPKERLIGGPIQTAEVHVDKYGRVAFINGRHRFAVLRDLGAQKIPVAMSKESIENARKYGLLA